MILRKCYANGFSRNNFCYGNVGDRVICPDWNHLADCGNGLHGLLNCNGDWDLLDGTEWLLIEPDDEIVVIDDKKCKFNSGIVVFRNPDPSGMIKMIDVGLLDSNAAFRWAEHIAQDREIVVDRITESKYAYLWGIEFGTHLETMVNRITDSTYAYLWARYVGSDYKLLIDRIDNSKDAFHWAADIGNYDRMLPLVIDPYWISRWEMHFSI